jgi:nicotinamide-nucleotide amidase
MNTELICIGTELLEGKVNTNAAYIGEKLSSLGLGLDYIITVGDSPEKLEKAVENAVSRSAVVILTGGLGPTFDDLTREAVAKIAGKKLILSREALSTIAAMFDKRGIDMPKNNERQAYLIDGAKMLPNPLGTAPGQLLTIKKAGKNLSDVRVFLLPGPPREMQAMFDSQVFPYLKKYETLIRKSATLHICGLGESLVDEKIRDIIDAERKLDAGSVSFTILAHQMMVDIKTSVSGKDEMLVDEMLHNIKNEFYEALGDSIFGEGHATLESAVGSLLMKKKATFSAAESCTGGLLSQKLTSVPGSTAYYREGFITYSNDAKVRLLGVKKETLDSFGAVSEQTALEMALGAQKASGSDYALSITGIAGPTGETPGKPVGLVYIGLAWPGGARASRSEFPGSRSEIRERSANQALELLRRQLISRQAAEPQAKPALKRKKK